MRLTELAIKRPVMMSMVFILFVFLGMISAPEIGVDLYPPVNIPYVSVLVPYPGAGPEEIENQVLKPVEEAISSVSGVKNVFGQAEEGKAGISIEFDMSVDQDTAMMDVQKKLDSIRYSLPEDAEDPIIKRIDVNADPILILAVSGDQPLEDTYRLVKDDVKDRLQHIKGVAEVTPMGGKEKEIQVAVDRYRLEAYGLTINQVIQTIGAQNLNVPAGRIDRRENEFLVRVMGEVGSLDELRRITLATPGGSQVMLTEVAAIENGYKDIRSYARLNGRDGVGISVFKQSDASMVATADAVIKAIPEIQRTLPAGTRIEVVQNNADFVHNTLNGTWINLIEGIFTTALVLFFFLREWRSTLIVGLAIPTSLIATLTVMYYAGFSFNVLTLLGLTMCIGILVDDSIVVLENIHRHRMMGKDAAVAALDGRTEIGMAAIAITLSDVVVFGPIAFMTGMVGQFFKQFGLTVVVATLFSLFVSFTLTPMLASILFRDRKGAPDAEIEAESESGTEPLEAKPKDGAWFRFQHRVYERYHALLEWSLSHRKIIVAVCLAAPMLVFTLLPLGMVKSEFLPRSDEGRLMLQLEMPPGTSLAETDRTLAKLEQRLEKIPEIKLYFSMVGRGAEDVGGSNNAQTGSIRVVLVPKKERARTQAELAGIMRTWVQDLPGARVSVLEPSGVNQPLMAPIQVEVTGKDRAQLLRYAEQIREIVAETPGAADVDTTNRSGQPEIQAMMNRQAADAWGLNVAAVSATLRAAISGEDVSVYRHGGQETDIRVSLENGRNMDPSEVGTLRVMNAQGQLVALNQIATVQQRDGIATIRHLNRQQLITVKANLAPGATLGQVMENIETRVGQLKMAPGYSVIYEGETKDMNESFSELVRALIISIVLVYAILVMLYESYLIPVIRMLALPLGMVGALLALVITGATLSLPSFIGLIMLDGLVAKNSTLLIDYTHTIMAREGLSLRRALVKAGTTRLRPIMMTTVTMIAGMLPTALATSPGSEIRKGMAIALIGGLLLSTLLTLVVIPVAYTLLDDLRRRFRRGPGQEVTPGIQPNP
ncbi:MAG: efflux RND transporter permease subunit [Solirubrobacterales bacterium]